MKHAATLLLIAALAPAWAGQEHAHHDKPRDPAAAWQQSLARAPLAVGAAFDTRGRLWLARVDNGRLLVSHSNDAGKSFSTPVAVNPAPEKIAADGENRPKLAFGAGDEVYLSWTRSGETPFSGDVRFARSLDGGRHFDAPLTVNDHRAAVSHRFESLLVTPDGRVHLLWIDKRDQQAAREHGQAYRGAALYHAVSADRGARFAANQRLAAHSCECCRLALAADSDGVPVVLWRHVFEPNVRDHALLRLDDQRTLRRVSFENWAIDACPHHGPALAIAADGGYHLAWFSGAPGQTGLRYARSTDRGATLTTPMPFGQNDAQAGHATLVANGREIVLAWKAFDGVASIVRVMRSRDGGAHWSVARTAARSEGASDRPQLLARGGQIFLAWNSAREGLRLLALDEPEQRP